MRDGPGCVFNGGFVAGDIGALTGSGGAGWVGCQKLPEDEWLGSRQLLLQVRSPVPLYLSPRMRGKLRNQNDFDAAAGLTPVHTGKTP